MKGCEVNLKRKHNFKYILLVILALFSSCKKDKIIVPEISTSTISTLTIVDIAFVYENGSAIEAGACINPNTNYAIAITTKSQGLGTPKESIVKYIFNGNISEISFLNEGTKIMKIALINGINVAQLVENKQETKLVLKLQTDFEQVN
jgi:hypothetical protein